MTNIRLGGGALLNTHASSYNFVDFSYNVGGGGGTYLCLKLCLDCMFKLKNRLQCNGPLLGWRKARDEE